VRPRRSPPFEVDKVGTSGTVVHASKIGHISTYTGRRSRQVRTEQLVSARPRVKMLGMGRSNSEQLPRHIVRDLQGIARALYAACEGAGAPAPELARIAEAGKAFATALDLSKTEPDTIGHRAALGWGDKGIAILSECLRAGDASTAALVSKWAERLRAR
jgi:hypothetical protein